MVTPESLGRRVDLGDIVKEYLDTHGFDGLYSSGECGCYKDNLFPCESPQADCAAGYRTECDCGDHDYHISPTAFVYPCGHVWPTEDAECLTCDALPIRTPAPEKG